jgi:5-methylcytosine-specific restriction endonuclease McrA
MDDAHPLGEPVDTAKLRAGLKESRKRKVREKFGKRCLFCGSGEKLEVAHIIPLKFIKDAESYVAMRKSSGNGRGISRKFEKDLPDLKRYINDEHNLAVLCSKCHKRYDHRDGGGKPRQTKLNKIVDARNR